MTFKFAETTDIENMLMLRQELIRSVKNNPTLTLDSDFIEKTKDYLKSSSQMSVIVYDNEIPIGCATICFINLIPTADHPSGKRAHLMNVYVSVQYRRRGIAREMVSMLIEKAKASGVTAVSLDATESGRPLYQSLGFVSSDEHMELVIR